MSSVYVRNQVKQYLAASAPTEKVIDISGAFDYLEDYLKENGITTHDTPWLGLEFIGDDEVPITIGSKGFRETGAIVFNITEVASLGKADIILSRGEALRDLFRAKRLGFLVIDSVTPVNFGSSSLLDFIDGYMSGSFLASYYMDKNLT